MTALERRRLTLHGAVQGVGFRPFAQQLAHQERVSGRVWNEGRGVIIEVQGSAEGVERYVERLRRDLEPPGRIDELRIERREVDPQVEGFEIAASRHAGSRRMALAPDLAPCADCLRELRDPRDRRHGYPFITCARCGPRFTITLGQPYDRSQTTMAVFPMCDQCRAEYEDIDNRRFHAEAFACPRCGPRAWLELPGGERGDLSEASVLLDEGAVVAVRGVGGFHLACDARSSEAVARLRAAKARPRKPLAVMVCDLDVARTLARLDQEAEDLLLSAEAPIVLAPLQPGHDLAAGVTCGLADVGLMLPSSPLHHLLFDLAPDALVMTSGNPSGEPITIDNEEARERLAVDAWLVHDRPIAVACDDSVVRSGDTPIVIRRARGGVPRAFDARMLPARRVLALGAELKATVATLSEGELVVGRHLGDLDNVPAIDAWREEIGRMLAFGQVVPEAVAHDLHPDFLSTVHAEDAWGHVRRVAVQHHHAHMAAVMIEHGLPADARVVAIVLDGLGWGTDGTAWGGEVLVGGYRDFERTGHLRAVPLPGGDRAAQEPGRMATSLLRDAGLTDHPAFDARFAEVARVVSASPLSSSAGRLFDGVAAILGLAPATLDYEAEAALRLEDAVDPRVTDAYPLPVEGGVADTRALVSALVADHAPIGTRAARFHHGLADGLARMAAASGLDTAVLAGGCLANRHLLRRLSEVLTSRGLRVLCPVALPPGDGAISAGQAAVCALALEE